MHIQTIKSRSLELAARYAARSFETASFRDKTLMIYKQTILAQLSAVFTANETNASDLMGALESYLKENWSLIQGTSLCYTALPNDEITTLLITIAQHIAEEKKRGQPNDLDDPATTPIHLLMPTIALEAARDGFPDFGPDVDIQHVLQTHVLGNDGLYLLPVRLVTELTLTADLTKKIDNPYYDLFKGHPESATCVGKEEYIRLMEHSSLTQAVFDTQESYESIANHTNHLLGQLRRLCRHLRLNSSHGGIGTEEDAAAGAYTAIAHFVAYYDQIYGSSVFRLNEKKKLPPELQEEIYKLIELCTQKHINVNATEQMETCIGTRREELLKAMGPHEALLSEISLGQANQRILVDKTERDFKAAIDTLTFALESNQYAEGYAKLGVHLILLETLHVPLVIRSLDDLILIQSFSAAEITNLCQSNNLKRQIVTQLANIDNLVIFLMNLSLEKITAFITALHQHLLQHMIKTPLKLSQLLISLDAETCETVTKFFLANIETKDHFVWVIRDLRPELCAAVCSALPENHLQKIMTKTQDFSDVMLKLTPEQCAAVCNTLPKNHLQNMITNADLFYKVMAPLSSRPRAVVVNALPKDLLQNRINNSDDFSLIMSVLTTEQRAVIFNDVKERMQGMISSAKDFMNVVRYLTPDEFAILCKTLKKPLQSFIHNAVDFIQVMHVLSPKARTIFFNVLKNNMPHFIMNAVNFNQMMKLLKPEHHSVVYNAQIKNFQRMIKNPADLQPVMCYLTLEQRNVVLNALKNHIPNMIKNTKDFQNIIDGLSLEERPVVLNALKNRWQHIIKNASDVPLVMHYQTTPRERSVVLNALKNHWQHIIKNASDLPLVMDCQTTPRERAVVFNALKNRWQNFIKNAQDFSDMMSELPPKQRKIVINALKVPLQDLINHADECGIVMHLLTPGQCAVVCNALEDRMQDIIPNGKELSMAMSLLKPKQRIVVFNALKDRIQDFIKTAEEFVRVLSELAPEQRIAFCKAMHNALVYLIKSKSDYEIILNAIHTISVEPLLDAWCLYQAIESIKSFVSTKQANTLLSALVTKDHDGLKKQIDTILLQPRNEYHFFTPKSHKERLIDAFTLLRPYWLKPIGEALEINNTIEAFSEYVNAPLAFGQKNMIMGSCA